MENIKEAFSRVKEDIYILNNEIYYLKKDLGEIRESQIEVCEVVKDLSSKIDQINEFLIKKQENSRQINPTYTSTHKELNPTVSTHIQTDYSVFKPLNAQKLGISTGNEGVQTDRQTLRQTDIRQETDKKKDNIVETLDALNKLDAFKKELRLKFKRLTDQEFVVFIKLYELEEQFGYADYKNISKQLNLTESSIRDYIGRIIKKGVPINKTKINNKMIQLYVAPHLKNIVSLQTIINLRGL